jgi:hypothetical protein
MAKGPKKDYRRGGVGAGKAGAGPLANPTSASTAPATAETTAPTAAAAIVQAVQESQVVVEGPYRVKLPKDKRRLSVDVAREALAERGYRYDFATSRYDMATQQTYTNVTFPDGSVRRISSDEIRSILYPKKPKPPR